MLTEDLERLGHEASQHIDPLVRQNNQHAHLPKLERFTPHGTRIEQIDHHPSYHQAGAAIYGSGVMSCFEEAPNLLGALARQNLRGRQGRLLSLPNRRGHPARRALHHLLPLVLPLPPHRLYLRSLRSSERLVIKCPPLPAPSFCLAEPRCIKISPKILHNGISSAKGTARHSSLAAAAVAVLGTSVGVRQEQEMASQSP